MRPGPADLTATSSPHRREAGADRAGLRRDAVANRDRVLSAAATAIRREGLKVPLATIAADAGVGIGTLYRSYPSRQAVLSALTHRSFGLVLEAVERALDTNEGAIAALGHFLDQTIDHGEQLILPLHGGPVLVDEQTTARRAEVHDAFERLLRRGRDDGTIRADVRPADIVVFGAFLAQPLDHTRGWKHVARRQARIYLDGLGGSTPLPDGDGVTR